MEHEFRIRAELEKTKSSNGNRMEELEADESAECRSKQRRRIVIRPAEAMDKTGCGQTE